jgi:segregation and condensation protein B
VNAAPAHKLKLAHPLPESEASAPESETPAIDNRETLRMLEALLFATAEPLDEKSIAARLPEGADVRALLHELKEQYATRGVNIVRVGGKWAIRTATDLGHLMTKEASEPKKLSRAAIETLAIIAYHQPVTRAEIEAIRGVTISRGTLDVLMETGWVRLRGRRRAPGRPVTYGTTEEFLNHFGLESIDDLPGLEELKGAGFLEGRLPSGFSVPMPSDDPTLREDEDPLEEGDLDLALAPAPEPESEEEAADSDRESRQRE